MLGVLICDCCEGEVHADCTPFFETPSPESEFLCKKCLASGKYTGGEFLGGKYNDEDEFYRDGNPEFRYKILFTRGAPRESRTARRPPKPRPRILR